MDECLSLFLLSVTQKMIEICTSLTIRYFSFWKIKMHTNLFDKHPDIFFLHLFYNIFSLFLPTNSQVIFIILSLFPSDFYASVMNLNSSFFTSSLLNFLYSISIHWFFHYFPINAYFLIKKTTICNTFFSFHPKLILPFLMIFRYFGRIDAIWFHKMYFNKIQNTDWIHWNNAVNTINFSPFFLIWLCVCVCVYYYDYFYSIQ